MHLTVILPKLPPDHCGLADYTLRLRENLESISNHSIHWQFLVASDAEHSRECMNGDIVENLPRDASALAAALNQMGASQVFLQFASYGFDSNGVPRFLAEGLRVWKQMSAERKLVVMFHETWPTGFPIWRKAFWLSRAQQAVAKSLMECADVCITSNQYFADMLRGLVPGKRVGIIPIGSNFDAKPSGSLNFGSLVVFGLQRSSALRSHADLLREISNSGLVSGLVLAGRSGNSVKEEMKLADELCPNLMVETAFDFGTEVPDSVRNCGLSLMDMHSALLSKSGRFHLACQLGQVAIAKLTADPEPPLAAGESFLAYADSDVEQLIDQLADQNLLAAISRNAASLPAYFDWRLIAQAWHNELQSLPVH